MKVLNQKEKEAIVQHHIVTKIKKGGFFFREGEKARGPVCLVSGKAKVFRTGVAGRENIIKMLKEQDLTGFETLFTESIWSAFSIAIEESVICTIEKQSFSEFSGKNADLVVEDW